MPVISSGEIVLYQESELNEAKQEDRHQSLLRNMALPINRLPPEIFIAIINLSLPGPTEFKPYPCLPFSWVCRHWRSIVLDNPMFWNRISFNYRSLKDITHPMVKEVLLRSHTLSLDLAIYNRVSLFHELQGPDANRVRMLRLGPRVYNSQYPPLSYFTALFPSLTMLFIEDYYKKIDLSIEPLPIFQALEVAIRNLGNLALSNNFPNLWWLQLRYEPAFPLIPLLEALQNLPCLRVLSLFPVGDWWKVPANLPKDLTLTFHHLDALRTGSPILQLITAPHLLYLECTQYPKPFFGSQENFYHFCGFDFSKISHIRCVMNYDEPKFYIMGKFKADTSGDDMTPLMIKNGCRSATAFDEISSSYPNELYIQLDFYSALPRLLLLFTIIKKSNNLNEIILNHINPSEWTSQTDEEKNLFLDALRSAKTVRNLTVSGNEFVTFCGYLNDGTLCLNLERLAYSTEEEQDFLDPLLKLMTERRKMCPQPLEVELTGFSTIPPQALEPAERLGLQLIQKPRDPSQLHSESLRDI